MNIPLKTLENGFSLPVYGLGTWQMGGKSERDETHDEEDIEAIRKAIDLGITHIDTAEVYAEGHAEELVGEAISGYDREKLLLVSKVFLNNFRYDDLLRACEASLKRLNTNYLDLYLLHRVNPPDIPVTETMKAMNRLVSEGLVRHIGVSNHTVSEIEAAQDVSDAKIVANQLHYNLQIREVEKKGLLAYCQKNDVMLIAWRPLQKGMLLNEGKELLEQLASKYGKTPSQIALNWLISQENVVTLSKTRNVDHLLENLGAVTFQMEKDDIELLRREFPDQQSVSDSVPLS